MLNYLDTLFHTTQLAPHGYCLTWRSDLVAMHIIPTF